MAPPSTPTASSPEPRVSAHDGTIETPREKAPDEPRALLEIYRLSWRCRIIVNSETRWPSGKTIIHVATRDPATGHITCGCRRSGKTDTEIVVDYLKKAAYIHYYTSDPATYNAYITNKMLHKEAARLGIDLLEAGNMWDRYADCVPRTKDVDLSACPGGTPFRHEYVTEDGGVRVYEGWSQGAGSQRSVAEMMEQASERGEYDGACFFCNECPYICWTHRREGAEDSPEAEEVEMVDIERGDRSGRGN